MLQRFFKVDVAGGKLLDMANNILDASQLRFVRGDTLVLCLQFCRKTADEVEDYAPAASSALTAIVKNSDARAAASGLVLADADQWNISGDWATAAIGTKQQSARFALTGADLLALFTTTVTELPFVFEIVETDGDGNESTICQTDITIVGDLKRGAEGDPAPGSPTYLSAAQTAALYVQRLPAGGNFRVRDGLTLQLLDPDTNLYHTLRVAVRNGVPSLLVDQTGET